MTSSTSRTVSPSPLIKGNKPTNWTAGREAKRHVSRKHLQFSDFGFIGNASVLIISGRRPPTWTVRFIEKYVEENRTSFAAEAIRDSTWDKSSMSSPRAAQFSFRCSKSILHTDNLSLFWFLNLTFLIQVILSATLSRKLPLQLGFEHFHYICLSYI